MIPLRLELRQAGLVARRRPWEAGHRVLHPLSLVVPAGQRVAVLGPSGGGKTTLGRLIAGLLPPTEGEVRVDGRDPRHHAGVQLLPQDPLALLHPALPLALQIRESALHHGHPDAQTLLAQVGLAHRAEALPAQLSGGERRRAALARVLAARPVLVVADEPTDGLDADLRTGMLDLLIGSLAADCTLLVITHDLDLLPGRFSRALVLDGGRVVDDCAVGALGGGSDMTRRLVAAGPP